MRVRVRMYRQGLGDCFLLTFGDGAAVRHVLIDCGTLGATTTDVSMAEVAADIAAACDGHLALVIATHEHKDHVAGFASQDHVFDALTIDHVWQAWTEDPGDVVARDIKKYNGDLAAAASSAAAALKANALTDPDAKRAMAGLGRDIERLLAFGGDVDALGADFAKTVHAAMTYIGERSDDRQYLLPGQTPLSFDWLPGVRVYVLGPPRDEDAIGRLGEHASPDLYARSARQAVDLTRSVAFAASGLTAIDHAATLDAADRQPFLRTLPFDAFHRLELGPAAEAACPAYYAKADAWRRIDADWLAGAADLALQLDGRTNNTSLALAFELVDDGSVLLFPGDAQLGNWLSWHEAVDDAGNPLRDASGNSVLDDAGRPLPRTWTIPDNGEMKTATTADLIKRTVFYKVGHHASHNATLSALGVELMPGGDDGQPDASGRRLTAMIPVDRAVAQKKHPQSSWDMPARALYERLIAKTGGRVLRSDIGWAKRDADFADLFDAARWTAFEAAQDAAETAGEVRIERLFVEWTRG